MTYNNTNIEYYLPASESSCTTYMSKVLFRIQFSEKNVNGSIVNASTFQIGGPYSINVNVTDVVSREKGELQL